MKTKEIKFSNLFEALGKKYNGCEMVTSYYKKEMLEMVQAFTKEIESDGTIVLSEEFDDYYMEIDNDNFLNITQEGITIEIQLSKDMLTNQMFINRLDENIEREIERFEGYDELSVDGLNFV